MNSTRLILTFVISGLGGCATPPSPPQVTSVPLTVESSPSVAVLPPKLLLMETGEMVLDGYVYKQFRAKTTANSHIDIVFLDTDGRALRSDSVEFEPRELRRHVRRRQPRAHYVLPVASLPPGTTHIQVLAHDEEHGLKTQP